MTLTIGQSLADAFEELENYEDALIHLGRDLRRTMPDARQRIPACISTEYKRAVVLRRERRLNDALRHFKHVAQVRARYRALDHPDTQRSLHGLALTLSDRGEFVLARNLFNEIAEKSQAALGPGHADVLTFKNDLAESLARPRRSPAARAT